MYISSDDYTVHTCLWGLHVSFCLLLRTSPGSGSHKGLLWRTEWSWKEKAYSCTPVQPTWWQLRIIRTYMLRTVSVKHTQKHPHPKTAYVCTCTRTHRNTTSTDHTPDWLSQLLILTAQLGTPVTLLVQILYMHAQLYSSWPTGLHTWIHACAISPHPVILS